jgi:hypothetical protein
MTAISNQNLGTFFLIWLNVSVYNFEENLHAQQQLQILIHHWRTFEPPIEYEQYIRSLLPTSHSDVIRIDPNIQRVSYKLKWFINFDLLYINW